MSIGSMQSIACCGLISTLYVSSLYVWRTPPSRQHPTTVKWRMLGVTLTSLVAWLPAWLMLRQARVPVPARLALDLIIPAALPVCGLCCPCFGLGKADSAVVSLLHCSCRKHGQRLACTAHGSCQCWHNCWACLYMVQPFYQPYAGRYC